MPLFDETDPCTVTAHLRNGDQSPAEGRSLYVVRVMCRAY
jgi:hypothetical protein